MAGETITKPVLHHVNLKTTRLQEMIDWYGLVVGMEPNFQDQNGAWLTNDGANHRLALLAVSGLKDDPDKFAHAGMHHHAFEYESLQQLVETYDRLALEGITPHASLDHGMTMSFYYADPDANSVELQADHFSDWKQSTKFMRESPVFAANPIGVSVDPALVSAAFKETGDGAEVHRRAYEGQFTTSDPLDLHLP